MVHDSSQPQKLEFMLLFYHIYYRICSSADRYANAITMHLRLPLPVLLLLLIRRFPNGVWQCTVFDVVNEIIKSQNSLNQKWVI